MLGKGMERTFLQRDFYQNTAEEVELSSLITDRITEGVRAQLDSSSINLGEEEKDLVEEVVRDSVAETITEEWIEEKAMLVIDDVLAYIKGEQDGLEAEINLSDKKEAVQANLQAEIQKAMESEMEAELQKREIPAEMEDRIREELRAELESETAIVGQLTESIPEKIVLADVLKSQDNFEEIEEAVLEFRQLYSFFNGYFHWILIVLLVAILSVAGVGIGLSWVGIGMLVSGLSLFLSLFVIRRIFDSVISDIGEGMNLEQINILLDPLFFQMNIFVLIYSGIGAALLAGGIIWKKNRG